MQVKEAAEAPAQVPPGTDTASNSAAAASQSSMAEQAIDQLADIAALSWSVSTGYAEQLKLTGETAKAEWFLSGRSLAIGVALLVCFGAGAILLWGSILLLLGYVLVQVTASVVISAVAVLLLQILMLCWCWRSLKHVLAQVGFSETWQQLLRVLQQTNTKGEGHAD
jgi:hypothetical protein